jgi:hypothetical protein
VTTVIEATVETVKEHSSDVMDALQQGMEAIGSRVSDFFEPTPPPPRSKGWLWLLLLAVLAAAGIAFWLRRSGSRADQSLANEFATRPEDRTAVGA